MDTMTIKRYRFISDPGHGWLEVPLFELQELDIYAKISGYSYIKGEYAYLEEDCDMIVFVEAWEKRHGVGVNIKEEYQEYTPIRQYRRFPSLIR